VAGAAHGHIGMIALGVFISIPIMIFGSKLIVKVLEKYRWIAYLGSGILAYTAGEMIVGDEKFMKFLNLHEGPATMMITIALTIAILLIGFLVNKRRSSKRENQYG
jgi:predicted tellurium resistance membrane protein TerC